MSKQLRGLLFLGVFFIAEVAFACSCEVKYFCDYLKLEEYDYKMVAVRAKVLDIVAYEDEEGITAAYFEVLEEYRNDVNAGGFIKLYGNSDGADCSPNVYRKFAIGTEVLLIIGVSITNSAGTTEFDYNYESPISDTGTYWEFGVNTCHSLFLEIENEVVKGRIAEGIFEYPMEFFNDMLEECDFDLQELNEFRCADENYTVYPNPNPTGKVWIKNSYNKPPISLIRIFDASGNFIEEHTFESFPEYYAKKFIEINETGLYFLQIHCEENVVIEQILIL